MSVLIPCLTWPRPWRGVLGLTRATASLARKVSALAVAMLLALMVALPGCNVHWPEPEELAAASDAAITTYAGISRMAEIVAKFKDYESARTAEASEDNATSDQEEDLP